MTKPVFLVPYDKFMRLAYIAGAAEGMQAIKDNDDFNKEGIVNGLKIIEEVADEIYESGVLNDKHD